jgi:two-component system, OmpR family, phosphate regulon sensor histidine kinase PhoR
MKKKKIKTLILAMTIAVIGLISLQIFWSIKTIETEKIRFDATINKILSDVVTKMEKVRTANILVEKVSGEDKDLVWIDDGINKNDSTEVVFFTSNIEENKMILDGHELEIELEATTEKHDGHEKSEIRILKKTIKHGDDKKHVKKIKSLKIDTIIIKKEHLISEVLEDMISFKNDKHLITKVNEDLVDSLIAIELNENGLEPEFYFGILNKGTTEFLIIKSGADKNKLLRSDFTKSLSPHEMFSNPLLLKLHIPNAFSLILKSIWFMFALSLFFISIIVFVYTKTVKMFLEQKKVGEVKNDLINNITHEFKTPISSISLASEALAEPKLLGQKDSVKRYSKIIKEENNKLAQLVETLLHTAVFEKSEIELKLEIVDIDNVLLELIEKVEDRNYGINISFENKFNESVELRIDIFHFRNIINNLIDNAIKYSSDIVNICLTLKDVHNGIEISIADKGIGISKNDQAKIFDTFYRVQTGNIHNVKGNGIGLSYVKKIVEAHNGSIKVVSKLNFGSTFIIILPYEK